MRYFVFYFTITHNNAILSLIVSINSQFLRLIQVCKVLEKLKAEE
jgi:hypothetical protein